MSPTFTWVSFHLKISVPLSASTRKHSANPARKSSRHSGPSFPYLAASQLFGPARTRCGGSNTTRLKDPSWYGRSRKSSSTSGSMWRVRWPSARPCERSVTVRVSWRRSPYTTSGCRRSNQNMRLPQQGSSTRFMASVMPHLRQGARTRQPARRWRGCRHWPCRRRSGRTVRQNFRHAPPQEA